MPGICFLSTFMHIFMNKSRLILFVTLFIIASRISYVFLRNIPDKHLLNILFVTVLNTRKSCFQKIIKMFLRFHLNADFQASAILSKFLRNIPVRPHINIYKTIGSAKENARIKKITKNLFVGKMLHPMTESAV